VLKWETLAVTGAKIVQVFGWGGEEDSPGTTRCKQKGGRAEMGDVNSYRGKGSAVIWWGEVSRDNQIEEGGRGPEMGDISCYRGENSAGIWGGGGVYRDH
jgi:hypothetical protein